MNITPVAGKHLPIQVDGPLQQVQKASTDKELIFATTTATRSNKSDYFNEEFDLNANYELNSDTWAHTMNYSFGKMDLNSTTTTDFSELGKRIVLCIAAYTYCNFILLNRSIERRMPLISQHWVNIAIK